MNDWLAPIANIAVIAGIVFLGIEVRQNNQLLRAEAVSALLDTRMIRLQAGFSRTLMGWQRDYFLFQEGLLSEDYIRTNLAVMKATLSPEQLESYSHFDLWDEGWKLLAAPDYKEFIEACVLADCVEF